MPRLAPVSRSVRFSDSEGLDILTSFSTPTKHSAFVDVHQRLHNTQGTKVLEKDALKVIVVTVFSSEFRRVHLWKKSDFGEAMLTLDADQLSILEAERRRNFAEHLAARASKLHPEAVTESDPDALIDEMDIVIQAARAHGFKKQSLMERFADLSILFGTGFEESEDWAREAFNDETLHPLERMRQAESTAVFLIREQ